MSQLHISKLDAVKRQLETSISLYFCSNDSVAIHVLSSASLELLTDLCREQDIKTDIDEIIDTQVKRGKQALVRQKLKEAYNFFKHANKDPKKTLTFSLKSMEMNIFLACLAYQKLTNESLSLVATYTLWFYCKYPDIMSDQRYRSVVKNLPSNKIEFFRSVLPDVVNITNAPRKS